MPGTMTRALGSVEVSAHPLELATDGGRALETRARQALGASPERLVIRLLPGVRLSGPVGARLARLKREAVTYGVALELRPSTPAVLAELVLLGLAEEAPAAA